jgi:hypothetical protein
MTPRTIKRLARRAAETSRCPVLYHPAVVVELNDVIEVYFQEWHSVVGRRKFTAFVAAHLFDDEYGKLDGLVCPRHQWIVVDDHAVARSRADLVATLVHEAAHVVTGYCDVNLPDFLADVGHLFDHGPAWGHRMALAAQVAWSRGEQELAELLWQDAEDARHHWNDVGPDITELLGGMPELRPWFG